MIFTKEQLINQAREEVAFWRERDELIPSQQTAIRLRLAEITLAALTAPEQDPVYQACKEAGVWVDIDAQDVDSLRFNGEQIRKVYTAPPAPVVPDEINVLQAANLVLTLGVLDSGIPTVAMKVWNACRAAMLQGDEPVTPANQLYAGENCWSCGKYFTYEQHSEFDGYCPHCDSPVDLDDEEDKPSKVVPTQPTEEMVSRAWREATGKCDHETIKRIYATMLAAAPQQEVK